MEKALFNQVGEVKGKENESEDSFSFQFTPQNENLKRTRGSLFTLVTVHGKSEDRLEKAKAYYHAFQSSYYAKAAGSIINGLSETLDHVEKEFVKKEEAEGLEFSLVAAVFWGAVLYLAKSGSSSVFVSRSGKLKKLEFAKVASGVLEDQDTVCLATEKFSSEVNGDELADLLGTEKFEALLEKVDKRIAEVPGAVCDIVRLSVNAPSEPLQTTTIGEVDRDGEVDLAEETIEEPQTNESVAVESLEPKQVAQVNDSLPLHPKQANKFVEIATKIRENAIPQITKTFTPLANALAKPWRKAAPGEHVDHVAVKRTRTMQVVAVIIVVLIASISFSFITGSANKNKTKVDALVAQASQSLKEATSIKSIDPNRATTLVNSAKKSTADAKKLDPKDARISSLESQEATLLAEISRSYNSNKLTTVADFTKLVKASKLTRLSLNGTVITATDNDNNNIYSVDLSSQTTSQIEGSFTKPNSIAPFSAGYYVQTTDGVLKLTTAGKTSSVATATSWGTIVGAATYQSNLYLLDKGKGEVWKYIATSNGLGIAKAYLQGEKPNLNDASGIAIDAYVWLVTKKGEVFKISAGKKQDFTVSNMQEAFSNVVDIYTDTEAKNLYLLDSGKARIVVISKDGGVYQAQYSNDQLHQATSVVVNESQKAAYVSVNGKILSVALK